MWYNLVMKRVRVLPFLLLTAMSLAGCATSSGGWSHDSRERVNLIPFYLKNRHGVFTIPYSRLDREGMTDDLYLCGLIGYEHLKSEYRRSWAIPLYYHDSDGFATLLCGGIASADWLTPFYFRNETDFHTLLWSVREDPKGERGRFCLPLLSAVLWETNSCRYAWYAVLGLAGGTSNFSGTYRESWALPFYSHKTHEDFGERLQKLEAESLTDVLSEGEFESGFAVHDLWSYGFLFADDERVSGRRDRSAESGDLYVMTHQTDFGCPYLAQRKSCREVTFDVASGARRRDLRSSETSVLWRLFRNAYDSEKGRAVDVLFIPVWR